MTNISGLFTKIYQDMLHDRVSLPHMPDVAIRLRKALANNNYTIDLLARAIQTDVNACAYLLNIANSPLYKTRAEATDIQSAIRIIGVSSVRNLITVYSLRAMAVTNNRSIKKHLNLHWQKSAYHAAISKAVARKVEGVDSDRALLAGLLQSVGALPILMKLEEESFDEPTDEEVALALEEYTSKVGNLLANKWGLDDELQLVIRNYHNLAYDGGNKLDIVDVVNIARLLSQIGSGNVNWPRIEDAPCLQKFSTQGMTMQDSLNLLKEANDDINEIQRFLSG